MRKHIVLDLDNTLVHSIFNTNGTFRVYKRPGLKRFLETLFRHTLSVSVWSAGTRPYVLTVVKKIFNPYQFNRLRFIYSRDHTTNLNQMPVKNLMLMINQKKDMTRKNTILIDDRHEHLIFNAGQMYIIPEWTYWKKDCHLEKLRFKILAGKL
tara:strand:+ start:300 stop:758 length:459 start_codon:yes stop_codon:yes gene_type:complete